jgi:hypothetical protein
MHRMIRALSASVLLLALWSAQPAAHDIPADTTVRVFIKPDGQRLHMLVRVQMMSINDIDWPQQKDTGYLDLARVEPFLRDASTMWIGDYMDVYENGRKLPYPDVASVRLVPDGDLSFEETYEVAAAHMRGERISEDTKLFPTQGLLDVMFDYKITSPDSDFAINPRFDRLGLRVTTNLKFVRVNGTLRAFEYVGLPGLVRLDPRWDEAAWRFLQMGFFYLLNEASPLLFLVCLILPIRQTRGLLPAMIGFVVAHSATFVASAAFGMAPGVLWFPPLIATLLAASIFYVALENIFGRREAGAVQPWLVGRRWIVALVFGLAHGFAFALALGKMLQFAGSHPTVSLLSFNLGIEAALVVVLALFLPGADMLFRLVDERVGTIVISAIVAHTAWHSMVDRYADFRRYPLRWPTIDLLFIADVLRWMMVAVVIAAAIWVMGLLRQTPRHTRELQTENRDL